MPTIDLKSPFTEADFNQLEELLHAKWCPKRP
jgi:hypothetical protein